MAIDPYRLRVGMMVKISSAITIDGENLKTGLRLKVTRVSSDYKHFWVKKGRKEFRLTPNQVDRV